MSIKPWVITLASLSALDAATTVVGLRRPGLVELNPFTAGSIELLGLTWGVVIAHICQVSIAIILVGLLKWRARWAGALGLLIIGGQIGFAALNNLGLCLGWAWFPYRLARSLLGY